MRILISGGAGFIGSAVIRHLINKTSHEVLNIDKLTYAGNLDSIKSVEKSDRYKFIKADICKSNSIEKIFFEYEPNIVIHLAAETHVDRSINNPHVFLNTNILGTYNLLEASRNLFETIKKKKKHNFLFHHISTDEVFGDLRGNDDLFSETSPYKPSSPYSASKASSDHLVRAWHRTYGLPIVVSNCSNNYGPFQFPEKLIPQSILNALSGNPITIYGNGSQVRDWLYVEDHADALLKIALEAQNGETYNIGGNNTVTNIDIVNEICKILESSMCKKPRGVRKFKDLITFVEDRPGHDFRYAVDTTKIQRDLDWIPNETFESGLKKTVEWYINNLMWCQRVSSKKH
tara:strand:+ start:749 stop:1786 length:1038 start_codon:yes stop_codon:yes gene_type:complete